MSRKKTITKTDKLGRSKTIDLDPEIVDKLNKADAADKARDEKVEKMLKPLREKSDFAKVMSYNHPKILIIPALLALAATGFS